MESVIIEGFKSIQKKEIKKVLKVNEVESSVSGEKVINISSNL
jgi:hypothetical protein